MLSFASVTWGFNQNGPRFTQNTYMIPATKFSDRRTGVKGGRDRITTEGQLLEENKCSSAKDGE